MIVDKNLCKITPASGNNVYDISIHRLKFAPHVGLTTSTSSRSIIVKTIIRDVERKGRVRKELVRVQERSDNLVEQVQNQI